MLFGSQKWMGGGDPFGMGGPILVTKSDPGGMASCSQKMVWRCFLEAKNGWGGQLLATKSGPVDRF